MPQKWTLYLIVQILACSYSVFQVFGISGFWYFPLVHMPGGKPQSGAEVTSYTVGIRELKFRFLIALSRSYYLLIRVFWELHQTYNNKHSFHWKLVAAVAAPQPFCNGTQTNQERPLQLLQRLSRLDRSEPRAFHCQTGAGAACISGSTRVCMCPSALHQPTEL